MLLDIFYEDESLVTPGTVDDFTWMAFQEHLQLSIVMTSATLLVAMDGISCLRASNLSATPLDEEERVSQLCFHVLPSKHFLEGLRACRLPWRLLLIMIFAVAECDIVLPKAKLMAR
ncbi:hypothetical protein COCNU_16G000050 [Cocos nucifera]|uniref:Uncharacterized protein n=1 Tax=Cocos nucifera TaxID=13894 RepID=A0A8K0NDN6_COCNU|nr:hypothetical protein COCNU_16G000050 [Cocos nucifera]